MSNNPFADHNVPSLSPNSINKFRKSPAKWLVNVAGYYDRIYNPTFSFGIAVEKGITHGCYEQEATINECIDVALREYANIHKKALENKADYDFQKCGAKQEEVAESLEMAVPLYRQFGTPISSQERVELFIDDLPVPIIGYPDMVYEDCVRDIKTTGIMPKSIRGDYKRQVSFYAFATDKKPMIDFIYSTKRKKEFITFEVKNQTEHLKDMIRIAMKMMRMLSLSSDIKEVAHLSCLEPDTSNEDFFNIWGTNEIIGAKELFIL